MLSFTATFQRVTVLLACYLTLAACSDAPLFMGIDHNRGEIGKEEVAEQPSEPVMVGGAFLTCAIVEGEFGEGPADIGCRIANRETRRTIELSAYQTSWDVRDQNGQLVQVEVKHHTSSQSLRGHQFGLTGNHPWHVTFKYPDNSYRNHTLQSSLVHQRSRQELYFDKSMDYFDEERDLLNADRNFSLGLIDSSGFISADSLQDHTTTDGKGSFCTDSTGGEITCGMFVIMGAMMNAKVNSSSRSHSLTLTSVEPVAESSLNLNNGRSEVREFVQSLNSKFDPFEAGANVCRNAPPGRIQRSFQGISSEIKTNETGFPCYLDEGIRVNPARDCATVWVYDGVHQQMRLHAIPLRRPGTTGLLPTEQELHSTAQRFRCNVQ